MSETVLTREDQGRTIDVSVGNALSLWLDESPTTGYAWVDRSTGPSLALANSEFLLDGAGAVGSGGRRCFRYSVLEPGTASVRLTLQRAWETDTPPADEFSVTVQARPAAR